MTVASMVATTVFAAQGFSAGQTPPASEVRGEAEGQVRGAPSDVPRDHWAFRAVDELFRAGILRGYPDGRFRGSRTASRHEMASALAGFYVARREALSGLERRLGQTAAPAPNASRQDRADLERQIAALRVEVARLKEAFTGVDDLKVRFADLQRQLELLRGDAARLRRSAGSGR